MHIVAIHGWKKEEPEVAKIIADIFGILVFEARQKIAGGEPKVLANFAESQRAEALADKLSSAGVPALVIDAASVLSCRQRFHVRRFELGEQALQLESFDGEFCDIAYNTIELLLFATCSSGPAQTTETVTERKFSLGKTLATGGIPMTRKVTREETVTSEQCEEILQVYAGANATMVFNRAALHYDGLGDAMQMSRSLNFSYLKNELRRLAQKAVYDERLLKRAGLVHLLGQSLSPETNLDLAFEILAQCLRPGSDFNSIPS